MKIILVRSIYDLDFFWLRFEVMKSSLHSRFAEQIVGRLEEWVDGVCLRQDPDPKDLLFMYEKE